MLDEIRRRALSDEGLSNDDMATYQARQQMMMEPPPQPPVDPRRAAIARAMAQEEQLAAQNSRGMDAAAMAQEEQLAAQNAAGMDAVAAQDPSQFRPINVQSQLPPEARPSWSGGFGNMFSRALRGR